VTGAALGIALVAIGLGVSFFAAKQWGLLGTATTIIGALLLAGGVVGLAEAGFIGLVFSALLFLALGVVIRSNFLMALVPLALAGALGSSTGYMHAVYMLTVTEPSITIAFFCGRFGDRRDVCKVNIRTPPGPASSTGIISSWTHLTEGSHVTET
jgi:hypothetical protein